MTTLRVLGTAALALGLMQGAAVAQSQGAAGQQQGAAQAGQNIPDRLRQKLENHGYSDVKIVPGSLLVSAKDKQGDPVTMIIGPRSLTVMTFDAASEPSTVGSGTPGAEQKKN